MSKHHVYAGLAGLICLILTSCPPPSLGNDTTNVTGISMTSGEVSLGRGAQKQLYASVQPRDASNRDVTWSTDDASVVTVSPVGIIRGITFGSTKISAKSADGGFVASCTVHVVAAGSIFPVVYASIIDPMDIPALVAYSTGSDGSATRLSLSAEEYYTGICVNPQNTFLYANSEMGTTDLYRIHQGNGSLVYVKELPISLGSGGLASSRARPGMGASSMYFNPSGDTLLVQNFDGASTYAVDVEGNASSLDTWYPTGTQLGSATFAFSLGMTPSRDGSKLYLAMEGLSATPSYFLVTLSVASNGTISFASSVSLPAPVSQMGLSATKDALYLLCPSSDGTSPGQLYKANIANDGSPGTPAPALTLSGGSAWFTVSPDLPYVYFSGTDGVFAAKVDGTGAISYLRGTLEASLALAASGQFTISQDSGVGLLYTSASSGGPIMNGRSGATRADVEDPKFDTYTINVTTGALVRAAQIAPASVLSLQTVSLASSGSSIDPIVVAPIDPPVEIWSDSASAPFKLYVHSSTTITFSTSSLPGQASFAWYVDDSATALARTPTCTISAGDYATGIHTLTVFATADGLSYSNSVEFTVLQ